MRPVSRALVPIALLSFPLTLVGIAWSAQQVPRPTRDPLRAIVTNYEDGGADFIELFSRASDRLGVPIGFELDGPIQPRTITISVAHGTGADVFSAIAERTPEYEWLEDRGVVNVRPRDEKDSLLDTRIRRFVVAKAGPLEIVAQIRSLPEVQAWLAEHHVTEHSLSALVAPVRPNGTLDVPRVSIRLKGASLREIMNSLVRKKGLHGWSFARYGQGNSYLNITIE